MWKDNQRGLTLVGALAYLAIIAVFIVAATFLVVRLGQPIQEDTTPPVISNIQLLEPLPAGTTETTFSFEMTELMPCWFQYAEARKDYGKEDGLESWTPAGSESTTYRAPVVGLSDSKTYTFRIRCMHMGSNTPDSIFTHVFEIAGN